MPASEIFRVNYYVNGLLAQGGNLWIDGAKIVFSPTSALDRAMGAKDVEILFPQIESLSFAGNLSRAFNVKTAEKIHKFEGSNARKVWETLEKALPNKGVLPPPSVQPKTAAGFCCDQCSGALQPGFLYCPRCAARVKSLCTSCKKSVDPHWSACAFCGWKFGANSVSKAA